MQLLSRHTSGNPHCGKQTYGKLLPAAGTLRGEEGALEGVVSSWPPSGSALTSDLTLTDRALVSRGTYSGFNPVTGAEVASSGQHVPSTRPSNAPPVRGKGEARAPAGKVTWIIHPSPSLEMCLLGWNTSATGWCCHNKLHNLAFTT